MLIADLYGHRINSVSDRTAEISVVGINKMVTGGAMSLKTEGRLGGPRGQAPLGFRLSDIQRHLQLCIHTIF